MPMPDDDRELLEENKLLVLELLKRHVAAHGRQETPISDGLFQQLGVCEFWLHACDTPIPAKQRSAITRWVAELRLNVGRGLDFKRGRANA